MRTIVIAGLAASFAAVSPMPAAASAPAAVDRNASVAAQPSAGPPADSARQICVADTRSESRVRRPICHTARDWIALEGEVPATR